MKIRILHFVQFLGVGGLEKVLLLLINEQVHGGHEVELVVYDYEQSWVEYFRSQGVKVDTSFRKSEGYDRKLLKFLSKKSKLFDVIHTHDLNPLMYAAPVKFFHTLLGKPFPKLIHTAHGMDHLNKRPITKLYEKICSYQTDATTGVSSAVCDYYLKLGVNKQKVLNINNGTPVTHFSTDLVMSSRKKLRDEFSLPADILVWVSVARIVPLKDQALICKAAKKFPEMVFMLVGPSGDIEYWNELKSIKPDNVLMLDSRSDINDILLGADCFISASKHEGIPISVLEAGALGLPCLLSDISGHKLIQQGCEEEVAFYFKSQDEDDLIAQVKKVISDLVQSKNVGSELRTHISKKFSSGTMYKHYLQVYMDGKCSKN